MAGGVQRLGETVTVVGSFFQDGDPITFAPTSLTLTITPPDGSAQTVITHPTPLLYHYTTHEWYYDLLLDKRGRWEADWLFTGSYIDGNGDTRPYIEPVTQVLHCYA